MWPRILAGSLEPSVKVLNKNHALLLQYNKKSHTFSWSHIKRMKYSGNILKLPATGRNVRSQGEISYAGINFLSHEEIYCHKRIFLSKEEISCHGKVFPVAERIFISKDKNFKPKVEISFYKKKFPITKRDFLSHNEISCHRK